MKKLYLIAFLAISKSLLSQNYIPITQTDNQWKVKYQVPFMVPEPCLNATISHIYSLGESVSMDGNTYLEVFKKYEEGAIETYAHLMSNCPEEAVFHSDLENITELENTLVGLIRDDEASKKVYFIQNGHSDESLLYDFDFPLGNTAESGHLIQMTEVTAFNIQTIEKREFYQAEFMDLAFEGVGNAGDLLQKKYYLTGLEHGGFKLEGFSIDNGQTFYRITNEIMNTNDQMDQNDIQIYPNPSKDIVYIKSHQQIQAISVYDLNGKRLSIHQNADKVQINHLPKGNYILIVELKTGQIIQKKLVKQ
jgi:hypothetical protein